MKNRRYVISGLIMVFILAVLLCVTALASEVNTTAGYHPGDMNISVGGEKEGVKRGFNSLGVTEGGKYSILIDDNQVGFCKIELKDNQQIWYSNGETDSYYHDFNGRNSMGVVSSCEDNMITLTAYPDDGYVFKGWFVGQLDANGFVHSGTGSALSTAKSFTFKSSQYSKICGVFEKETPAEPVSDEVSVNGLKYRIQGNSATVTGAVDKNAASTVNIPGTVDINGKKKVTAIGANAFEGMTGLKKVKGGKNIKTIGAGAFSGDKKLSSFPALSSLEKIGDNAFKNCKALKKFTIGKKVKSIGKQAFYGCKKLKTITVKSTKLTKKKIGKNAFKGISSSAVFKCPGSKLENYAKWFKSPGGAKKAAYTE